MTLQRITVAAILNGDCVHSSAGLTTHLKTNICSKSTDAMMDLHDSQATINTVSSLHSLRDGVYLRKASGATLENMFRISSCAHLGEERVTTPMWGCIATMRK